jgi:hypothetical protein
MQEQHASRRGDWERFAWEQACGTLTCRRWPLAATCWPMARCRILSLRWSRIWYLFTLCHRGASNTVAQLPTTQHTLGVWDMMGT